jgi:hypothetical protein
MLDEHIDFFETIGVEQQLDALARRQLAARVLRFNALFPATQTGNATPLF